MQNDHRETESLTPEMVAKSRVVAKGRKIREISRILRKYGGKTSKWMKKSSPVFEIDGENYEFHWYENREIGRIEIKLKKV